jgi:type II secretory pathway pseudopilin PulG
MLRWRTGAVKSALVPASIGLRCYLWIFTLKDMESQPPIMSTEPKTSGLAIASVICGPLGFLTAGLSGIAAVITGHMALSAIKRSGGFVKGTGMAITGLVTGYISILILPIAILAGLAAPVILKQRQAADRTEAINNMKQLNLALIDFDSDYGSFPSDETAKDDPAFAGLTGPRVLKQLEAAGCVKDLDRLLAVRGAPDAKWYYFPGVSTSGDPARPVLITPAVGDKVAVLRIDGSTKPEQASSLSRMDLSGAVEIPAPKKKR